MADRKCSECGAITKVGNEKIQCYIVSYIEDGIGGYIAASNRSLKDTYEAWGTRTFETFSEAKKNLMGTLQGERNEAIHQLKELRTLKKAEIKLPTPPATQLPTKSTSEEERE